MEQYPGGTYIVVHSSITNNTNSVGQALTAETLLEAKKKLEQFMGMGKMLSPSWATMICQVCSGPIQMMRSGTTRTTKYLHLDGEVTVSDEMIGKSSDYYDVQAWARGVHEYQEADGQEG